MKSKLTIEEFGRQLIISGDLDPYYITVYRAIQAGELDDADLYNWLLTFWFTFHLGTASRVVTRLQQRPDESIWDLFDQMVAKNQREWQIDYARWFLRLPIGRALTVQLRARYRTAWDFIAYVSDQHLRTEPIPFALLQQRVEEHTSFGYRVAFKAADMLDRILYIPVDISAAPLGPKPIQGAQLTCSQWGVPYSLDYAFKRLGDAFADLRAPPDYRRPVGLFELETVLCKWKSYNTGSYWPGKDLDGDRKMLRGCGPLAERLASYIPARIEERGMMI